MQKRLSKVSSSKNFDYGHQEIDVIAETTKMNTNRISTNIHFISINLKTLFRAYRGDYETAGRDMDLMKNKKALSMYMIIPRVWC